MDNESWECPKCGTENHSKFCIRCGMSKPEKIKENGWHCSSCGQVNYGKFCTKCGKPRTENSNLQDKTTIMPKVAFDKKKVSQNTHNKQKKILLVTGIIMALFIAAGAGYYYSFQQQPQTSTIETTDVKTDIPKPTKEMKTDLSLGGLDIDDAQEMIQQVELQTPNDTKQEGKLIRYYYDDMQIVVQNGKITALVSNNDSVNTKKEIHQGSTFADVKNAYGTDYQLFDLGNGLTAYEYWFKSQDGHDGLLRFAIKDSDHKVDYISVRIPE